MVLSFLAGIILAFSQHLLYRSLHHTSEDDEGKRVRVVLYGRALAYFSKVAFASCLILCYRQRIWRTFREQSLSVWSIDQLFLATEDASLFLNWETISKATLVTSMAFIIWMIPIATIIFSPGALTFGDYFEVGSSNISVPNLNFSMEGTKDWRAVVMQDGLVKKSMRFENTTSVEGTGPGWFDYYDKPSSNLKRISLMTAYSLKMEPINKEDARHSSCGGDFNCTYTVSFIGPGYKCEEMANGVGDDKKLIAAGAPFNTSQLAPQGRFAYFADVDGGSYLRPQSNNFTNNGQGGVPAVITEDIGVIKSDAVLWIGHAVNSTEPLPNGSPLRKNWTHRIDPHVFRCIHYTTRYTVDFNYSGPFYRTNITYDFLAPIVNTTFPLNADGITLNYKSPEPVENFVRPNTDVAVYKTISSYMAMGESLRDFLRGNMELNPPIPGPTYTIVHSDMANTRLLNINSSMPLDDLRGAIQDFYASMILSLLSAPSMLVVQDSRVRVNTTRYRSTFIYTARKLWACYIPVIFFVFVFLLVGAWTIYEDGTTFSDGFSRILVTTRNTTLDDISRGACLGNDPFPRELMNTKLQFGVLNDENVDMEYMASEGPQLHHCTFGVPSEIMPIVKGEPYAGLLYRTEKKRLVKEKAD
ncbi:hypothetical protein P154DRAFT_436488 [Amniculicola lignicola CBS 123094]|uniref:Uncharacterized protein n=1 Tax=Amniculicola lignicola CBS 123094 TaxID=1392246 RepID=A0A6A5WFE2_9PLEO|nr:hypothetical protein P154DRAFT_436488 [Amniculicola lignicola CBS 123094]